jgi:hypothetical protein
MAHRGPLHYELLDSVHHSGPGEAWQMSPLRDDIHRDFQTAMRTVAIQHAAGYTSTVLQSNEIIKKGE